MFFRYSLRFIFGINFATGRYYKNTIEKILAYSLEIFDYLIILLYFIIVILIGFYYATSNNNADDYFFAGRKMSWILIGFSIFATNISSEHFVGLASAANKSGIVVGHFEWLAIIFIIALGYVFAPKFLNKKINTIPELVGEKYNPKVRKLYSALSIFTYVFTKVAISLLAGGILLNGILGWNFATSVIVMLLFTGIYTIVGGLRSVMYTQIFQSAIFIVGSVISVFYGIKSIGGIKTFVTLLPESHLQLFKSLNDANFPWLGILLGAPILAAWYWWADQYIAQRILSAKDVTNARKGSLLAAALKIFPIIFLIIPGLLVYEIFGLQNSGAYYKLFTAGIFPMGVKGLIISGFFAALMSSLASAFNSAATLIAYDFFGEEKQKNNDAELILVGRLSTIIIVIVSLIFIPMLNLFDNSIYVNLQKFQAYISPPIVLIFLLAVFGKRYSSVSAFTALIVGEVIGLFRIMADIFQARFEISSPLIKSFQSLNYLYFAPLLFVFTGILYFSLGFFFREETEKIKTTVSFDKQDNSTTKRGVAL